MSSLAWSLAPKPWEPLDSFVNRLAATYATPLGAFLRATGLQPSGGRSRTPELLLNPNEQRLRQFASTVRLEQSELDSLRFRPFAATVATLPADEPCPDLRAYWLYNADTHACPECLRERSSAWHMWWKVPWSFCCVRHECLLIDHCPHCSRRVGARDPRGRRIVRPGAIPRPGRCAHSTQERPPRPRDGSDRCDADLAAATAESIADHAWLLATQRHIDAILAGGRCLFAGREVSSAEYFAELRALSALVLHFGDAERDIGDVPSVAKEAFASHTRAREIDRREHPSAPAHRRFFHEVPRSLPLMAAVIPTAVWIADADTESELRGHLAPIAETMNAKAPGFALSQTGPHYNLTPTLQWTRSRDRPHV